MSSLSFSRGVRCMASSQVCQDRGIGVPAEAVRGSGRDRRGAPAGRGERKRATSMPFQALTPAFGAMRHPARRGFRRGGASASGARCRTVASRPRAAADRLAGEHRRDGPSRRMSSANTSRPSRRMRQRSWKLLSPAPRPSRPGRKQRSRRESDGQSRGKADIEPAPEPGAVEQDLLLRQPVEPAPEARARARWRSRRPAPSER